MAAFQDMRKVAWMNFLNSCVNFSLIMATVLLRRYIVFLSSVTFVFGVLDLILYWHFVKKHIPKPEVLKGLKLFDLGNRAIDQFDLRERARPRLRRHLLLALRRRRRRRRARSPRRIRARR